MRIGFILPNGELIEKGGERHDSIAMTYLFKHKNLKKQFDKSDKNLCDFMVLELGAIKVGSNAGDPNVISYCLKSKLSKETEFYIELYAKKGYRVDVIIV